MGGTAITTHTIPQSESRAILEQSSHMAVAWIFPFP